MYQAINDAPKVYHFHAIYKEGSSNESDHMSRHPDTSYSLDLSTTLGTLKEHYIDFLVGHNVPKHITVQTATKNDEVLCKVKLVIKQANGTSKIQ